MDKNLELDIRKGYSDQKFTRRTEALEIWIKSVLKELCYHDDFIHDFTVRRKNIESLLGKVEKQIERREYFSDFESVSEKINDLVGSRVMVYLPSKLKKVHDLISRIEKFNIKAIRIHDFHSSNEISKQIEREIREQPLNRKGDVILFNTEENETGYFGIHYVIEPIILDPIYDVSDIKPYNKFELQLRTLINHAWSEVQHKIVYKSISTADKDHIKTRFADVAYNLFSIDQTIDRIVLSSTTRTLPDTKSIGITEEKFKIFQMQVASLINNHEQGNINFNEFQETADRLIAENQNIINKIPTEIEAQSENVYTFFNLGELYLKSRKLDEAYDLYSRMRGLDLRESATGKILLRLSETCSLLGNKNDEAKTNIIELASIVQSNPSYTDPENYLFFMGAAKLSWSLQLYDFAVEFGTRCMNLEAQILTNSNEDQLKTVLNLIYYKIDKWQSDILEGMTSSQSNILSYIDEISCLSSSDFQKLINTVSSDIDLANQILGQNTHANASMYDSLSWYYAHESISYYLSNEKEKSNNSINEAERYNEKCYITWAKEEKAELVHIVWGEHDTAIKKIKKIINDN